MKIEIRCFKIGFDINILKISEIFPKSKYFFNRKISIDSWNTGDFCRIFRNVTSNSIKPWYHCPRDGGRAEIHKNL